MTSPDDAFAGSADVAELPDPPTLKREDKHPGIHYQDMIKSDRLPPADSLLIDVKKTLGTDPIPVSRYASAEYADLEAKHVWPKVWQFACWAQDIPNPGDIHVYRILDRSVLIVRQRDLSIKAFVNACLHRGRELCEEHAHQGELKCPYHFFTWGLDGGLKWTPSEWDFPQVKAENFRLPEVRVEEWNGFLFINFDDDAPSLSDYMGEMDEHWKSWDFSKRFKAVHVEKHIQCNWKAGQDAFIESFHAFMSHNQGAILSSDDCAQYDIFENSPNISRFLLAFATRSHRFTPEPNPQDVVEMWAAGVYPDLLGTDEAKLKPGETTREACERISRRAAKDFFGVDTEETPTSVILDPISYFLFPNFMPWPCLSYPLVYRFRPGKNQDWCIWDTYLFFPFEGERPPSCETIVLGPEESLEDVEGLGGLGLILQQDAEQLPAVQRGMKNLKDGVATLTQYQELRIRHYHKLLEQYIGS